eukprot:gene11854-13997_t
MPNKAAKGASRSKKVTPKAKTRVLRKGLHKKLNHNKDVKAKMNNRGNAASTAASGSTGRANFRQQVLETLQREAAQENLKVMQSARGGSSATEEGMQDMLEEPCIVPVEQQSQPALQVKTPKRKTEAPKTLEAVQAVAQRRHADFTGKAEASLGLTAAGDAADPDGSRRAFYKVFTNVVQNSDVVLHVLDARDPLGCRCVDVERYVLQRNPNAKIVLLLNKIDLVPRENVQAWLKYLREEAPTVAFKCATAKGAQHTSQKSVNQKMSKSNIQDVGGNASLGADTLLQLLKNYARNRGIKTAITVGVIGFPNVGKSSLINSLMRTRTVATGATPGLTRQAQ